MIFFRPCIHCEKSSLCWNNQVELDCHPGVAWVLFKDGQKIGKSHPMWLICITILYDEFIWEIWVISETWLDCSKLTYHTCNSTNKGPKNWFMTFLPFSDLLGCVQTGSKYGKFVRFLTLFHYIKFLTVYAMSVNDVIESVHLQIGISAYSNSDSNMNWNIPIWNSNMNWNIPI